MNCDNFNKILKFDMKLIHWFLAKQFASMEMDRSGICFHILFWETCYVDD